MNYALQTKPSTEIKPKLLIVDDEPQLRAILSEYLVEHFTINVSENGTLAIEVAREWKPDVILMDVMMPGLDGIGACKVLREGIDTQHIPILMLTAVNTPDERIRAYDLGADDFISKPFDFNELISRLQNKLLRAKQMKLAPVQTLSAANIVMNLGSHEVMLESKAVVLSPVEFGILKMLLENKGQVVTRKDILKSVWEDARKKDRLIDAHVTSLRKKIDGFSGEVQTIYGLGYKLTG